MPFNELLKTIGQNLGIIPLVSPVPNQEGIAQAARNTFYNQQALKNNPTVSPTPSPTPTQEPQLPAYRNPEITNYLGARGRALKPDEVLSGADIATKEYGIMPQLIMDILGLESNAGQFGRPFEEFPGQYASEEHARGPAMFLRSTAVGEGMMPEDRYSATESARAVARKLNKGQLGEWDVSDRPGAGGKKLTDFYTEDELSPYSFNSMKRRQMLKSLK